MTGHVTSAYIKAGPESTLVLHLLIAGLRTASNHIQRWTESTWPRSGFSTKLVLHIRRAASGAGLSPLSDACVTGVLCVHMHVIERHFNLHVKIFLFL